MGNGDNIPDDRNAARDNFATRLRRLRVEKGFRTARSLARALEIDENRYTRYERAEVEPDLSLLRRICDVLMITPNDLLGREAAADQEAIAVARQTFNEGAYGFEPSDPPAHAGGVMWTASPTEAAAWKLSSLVARIRTTGLEKDRTAVGAPQPLTFLQSATALFLELNRRPIEAIGEIVRDPMVLSAGPEVTRDVNELAMQIANGLAQQSQSQSRLGGN